MQLRPNSEHTLDTIWAHSESTKISLRKHAENIQKRTRRKHSEIMQRTLTSLSERSHVPRRASRRKTTPGWTFDAVRQILQSLLCFRSSLQAPSPDTFNPGQSVWRFGLPRKGIFWFSPASRSLAALKVDKFLCIWVLQAPSSVSRLQTKNWRSHCAEF